MKIHMTWLRWLTLGLLGVLLLFVLAFGYLMHSFDPNDYREEIVAVVTEQTGHAFTIDGPMKLRLQPPLIGFEARNVTLGNLPGFPGKHLLAAQRFEGYLNFLPLLTGRLDLHSVHIEGLDVQLYRKRNGSANWDRLTASVDAGAAAPTALGASALSVVLQEAHLRNSAISYTDLPGEQHVRASISRLALSDIGSDGEASLEANGTLQREQLFRGQPTGTLDGAAVQLQSTITMSADAAQITLADVQLEGDLLGPEKLQPKAQADQIALDFASGRHSVSGFLLREGATELRIDPWTVEHKGPASFKIAAGIDARGVMLRRIAQLGNLPLQLPTNPAVLQTLDVRGDVRMHLTDPALSEIRVSNIAAAFDTTQITGGVSVLDFDQPRVGVDLSVGTIDLDAYLPLAVPVVTPNIQDDSTLEQHPTTGLRLLDGNVQIEQLQWRGFTLAALDTKFGVDPYRYQLHTLTGHINGSNMRADGSINIEGGIPEYHLAAEIEQLEIGQILSQLTAKGDSPLEGATDLQLNLTGRGTETERFLSSLAGTIGIVVQSGALHVGSVAHAVESAIAVLQGRPGQTTSEGTLPFNLLRSKWTATDGRFHSNDLELDADDVRVTAQGHLDLPKQEANYRFVLTLGEGLSVPGRIEGPFDDLSHSVDLSSLVRDQVTRQIRDFFGEDDEEEEEPEQTEDATPDEEPVLPVPDLLRGLF